MKSSVRDSLARSHAAAIAVAVLLLWSVSYGLQTLRDPFFETLEYLATAIAVRGFPSRSFGWNLDFWLVWMRALLAFINALVCLGAAWILSRWVYGIGPLRAAGTLRSVLIRRS